VCQSSLRQLRTRRTRTSHLEKSIRSSCFVFIDLNNWNLKQLSKKNLTRPLLVEYKG
jgi:hypothetical protein